MVTLSELNQYRDAWVEYSSGIKQIPENPEILHPDPDPQYDNDRDIARLITSYFEILRTDFHQGITQKEMLKLDNIDFTDIMMKWDPKETEYHNIDRWRINKEFIEPILTHIQGTKNEEIFLFYIPPYDECVYKVISALPQTPEEKPQYRYIHCKIRSVDTKNRQLVVEIDGYEIEPNYGIWMTGPYGVLKIWYNRYEELYYTQILTGARNYASVYLQVPYKYLVEKKGWNLGECMTYHHYLVEPSIDAIMSRRELPFQDRESDLIMIANTFIRFTSLLNGSLDLNRSQLHSTPIPEDEDDRKGSPGIVMQKRGVVRTIGLTGIRVRSHRKLIPPEERKLPEYTTAVWKRRGHIRHLHSGETTFVREAELRRHTLQDMKVEKTDKGVNPRVKEPYAPKIEYTVKFPELKDAKKGGIQNGQQEKESQRPQERANGLPRQTSNA